MTKPQININHVLITIISFLIVIFLIFGCTYINRQLKVKNDWVGEECVEEIIKSHLGIDLDLTPQDEE